MLKNLFTNNNCLEVTHFFFALQNVKVTKTTLEQRLTEHPNYPSLLAVSDILKGFGVENLSFKSNIEKIGSFEPPFIALVKQPKSNTDFFTIVKSVNDSTIEYLSPQKKAWEFITKEEFSKLWPSGIILMADAENATDEKEYPKKRRDEKRVIKIKMFSFIAIPLIALTVITTAFINVGTAAILPIIFTFFSLVGSIVGILLLWYEVDQHNPILNQICSAGERINCGAILNSKASKIMGISWSSIGFTYFTGALLALLFINITNINVLTVLAWVNLLSSPYILYSIYYQWKIAKQWCALCLCTQLLLALQLLTSISAKWLFAVPLSSILQPTILFPLLLAYTIPLVTVSLLLPAYRKTKEGKRNKTELQRLKHNPEIFSALLAKQKAITESTQGLGITLGNPNATIKIIKVCNPYCGPCAKAHSTMEEILENNHNIQIQILFTASNNKEDPTAVPVRHLLAIAQQGKEDFTKKALDDWYLADKKDYHLFASKYPMNGELGQQADKIKAMKEWCNMTEITFTPTFFVNGHQLPAMYNVSDLKYFLAD